MAEETKRKVAEFECDVCGNCYETAEDLEQHIRIAEVEDYEQAERTCPGCGEEYAACNAT